MKQGSERRLLLTLSLALSSSPAALLEQPAAEAKPAGEQQGSPQPHGHSPQREPPE